MHAAFIHWWGEPRVTGDTGLNGFSRPRRTLSQVIKQQKARAERRRMAGKLDRPHLYPQYAFYRKNLPGLINFNLPHWILRSLIWVRRTIRKINIFSRR